MHNGFAIALAWPQTFCKQAGAWYDPLLYYFGINQKGYYKVGHAALVLVDDKTGCCSYFDFGRYHAPNGYGRVRSEKTDHDLTTHTKAILSADRQRILNIEHILSELLDNTSTHGTGIIFGAATRINFTRAFTFATQLQEKEFISYGPFLPSGTNCSRFVNAVLRAGRPVLRQRILLHLPPMLTPTPMWNLRAFLGEIYAMAK